MAQRKFDTIPANPGQITMTRVDTVTGGTAIDVSFGGGIAAIPDYYIVNAYTRATTPCAWTVSRVPASDSTANKTMRLVWDAETGGDLTGAVFDVFFFWNASAAGGIG